MKRFIIAAVLTILMLTAATILAASKPVKIDTKKSGVYTHGKWRYEYRITAAGTRSETRYGKLFYDDNPIIANKFDRIETPWGMMQYFGPARETFHCHLHIHNIGWLLKKTYDSPIDMNKGKLLPSPEKMKLTPSYLRPLKVGESANGKTIQVIVGQKIIIALKGNPTTGYSWQIKKIEGDAIWQIGKVKYLPREHAPRMVGAGGIYIFTFQAQRTGVSKLLLEYKRAWEKNKPPARTFTAIISVKPDPSAQRIEKIKNILNPNKPGRIFELIIEYHGPPGKLDRKLGLIWETGQVMILKRQQHKDNRIKAGRPNPNVLRIGRDVYVRISKKQVDRIIDHLADVGFFCRAMPTKGRITEQKGCYLSILLSIGEIGYYECLDMGQETIERLNALKGVLTGAAAVEMDKFIKQIVRVSNELKGIPSEKPQLLKETAPQGVIGKVVKLKGNFMPTIGLGGGNRQIIPLSVPIWVFKGKVKPFSRPNRNHPALVKIVRSDKNGLFRIVLPPGRYTIVAQIKGRLYLNSYDGEGFWTSVIVKKGRWTTFNIKDTSEAVY